MPAVREAELYSLPEVARATGIPLPDLQRLRRDHADELPSVVVGEAKRYPDEALAVFRRLHGANGGDGEALKPQRAPAPRRESFSLSAQRRGGERPATDGAGNGAAQRAAAAPPPPEEVVDPGPPAVFDEMALALGQLGDDEPKATTPVVPRAKPVGQRRKKDAGSLHRRPEKERRESRDRRPEHAPRPERERGPRESAQEPPAEAAKVGSLAAAIERVKAAKAAQEKQREDRPQSAALRQAGPAGGGADSPPAPDETASEGRLQAADESADGHAVVEAAVVKSEPEPAEAEIARPKPPLYTLQQIHERTGIPYSKLSLLAASHAAEIPSAGERYSPAYPLAGLQAFCRIYGEQNPGWEAPPLGPEPGWDDDEGIARRIAALAALQERWSDELEAAVDRFARPWSGQAAWES